jgi:hypothetical protein
MVGGSLRPLFCKMDCISGFSKYIDIASKLFSTREYLKTNLTKLISVENTIFLSLFSEHVFIPEPEVHQWWKKGKSLFV